MEAHVYGPQSSPEQLEALRQRVELYAGDIVLYREIPTLNCYSVDLCYERVTQLVEAHGCRAMIVDIRESGRPDAEVRKRIKQRVELLQGRLLHLGIVASTSPLLKVATRFIQATLPVSLSVYDSVEAAEKGLRSALG